MLRWACVLMPLLLLAACDPGDEEASDVGFEVPDGFSATELATGLDRPTQMTDGPDGRVWVAQLAGEEDEGAGEVVAVDPSSGDIEVLLDGLDKPTGLAVADDHLWVVEERSVASAPITGSGVGEPTDVLTELPYNGRSLGTLTVTGDDTLLYNTTGARDDDGERVEGSATLWELDPAAPEDPEPLATGVQNAYAHAIDGEGRLWATEISAGQYDGDEAPELINRIVDGGEYGWPRCVADQAPVSESGGSREECAQTERPAAILEEASTPTGLVASPWEDDELIVAQWVTGEIVTVAPALDREEEQPAEPELFLEGLDNPQDLHVRDGALLVTEHATGAIVELVADG